MESRRLSPEHRAAALEIASRHGAFSIRVFGSQARGDARPDSDLDLLVRFSPGSTLLDQAALTRDLEEALGCAVDVVSERALRPRIRDRVLREAVPL
ncbi:MAG: nucleotidyltransferase family protein [Planctomycetes bacterium]|nr:nucleotidyltransferase family protein [Planctomycetota bacterium]